MQPQQHFSWWTQFPAHVLDVQCGTGETRVKQYSLPTLALNQNNVIFRSVAAGRSFTCARTLTGAMYCWGGLVSTNGEVDTASVHAPHFLCTWVV